VTLFSALSSGSSLEREKKKEEKMLNVNKRMILNKGRDILFKRERVCVCGIVCLNFNDLQRIVSQIYENLGPTLRSVMMICDLAVKLFSCEKKRENMKILRYKITFHLTYERATTTTHPPTPQSTDTNLVLQHQKKEV
jgi:hypothetical protein